MESKETIADSIANYHHYGVCKCLEEDSEQCDVPNCKLLRSLVGKTNDLSKSVLVDHGESTCCSF